MDFNVSFNNMSCVPLKCSLSVTCSFRGTRAVKFEGGLLKLCEGGDGTKLKTREKLKVNEDDWDLFSKAASFTEVNEWKSDFDPNEIDLAVFDGCSWVFEYENSGVKCSTGGVNAYPLYNVCKTTLDPDRVWLLILAMDCLVGRRYLVEYL